MRRRTTHAEARHIFYYYGNPSRSSEGIGFVISKKFKEKFTNIRTISEQVAYIILSINDNYNDEL
jgi:hypothetical protein